MKQLRDHLWKDLERKLTAINYQLLFTCTAELVAGPIYPIPTSS